VIVSVGQIRKAYSSHIAMSAPLHIIEPTLRDRAGHCNSFVRDLIEAEQDSSSRFHLWMHCNAEKMFDDHEAIVSHRYFHRRLRRFQSLQLYRRLIASSQRFLITTSTNLDLILLDLAAPGRIQNTGKIFCYVHWYRPTNLRLWFLRRMAQRHPGIEIICSTQRVKAIFEQAGFERVHRAPYPCGARNQTSDIRPFRTLLYAGAARLEKGFDVIVDFVTVLKKEKSQLPITVQCSPNHHGEQRPKIQDEIRRLCQLSYPYLRLVEDTLDETEYHRQFTGALTLQPYQPKIFRDRISGITMDSLTAGSPLIVPRNTWLSRQVDRFEAGISLPDVRKSEEVHRAVNQILADWPGYARRAAQGGRRIASEHDSRHLLAILQNN